MKSALPVYANTMNTHTLRCTACSRDHTPDMRTLHCQECASPLVVAYPSDAEPVLNASPVSLGEGHTPVVPLPAIADSLGLNSIYAKLEFAAPTGSFKDRGTAVMLAVAREFGVEEIVEDSSGNAGASVAAYAARCGIKAHVFAPDSAPETKLRQIKVYGAELHLVPGPREAAAEAALAFCEEHNLVYASHNLSPYFLEGTKTFAHELPTNFPDGLPDHIVMPVGNGSLFLGAWLGLRELQSRGAIDTLPKLHVVQAEPVMPIVAAFRGQTWAPDPAPAPLPAASPSPTRQDSPTSSASSESPAATPSPSPTPRSKPGNPASPLPRASSANQHPPPPSPVSQPSLHPAQYRLPRPSWSRSPARA